MIDALRTGSASVVEQWQSNVRLRGVVLLALALVWVWLLLVASDHIDARTELAAQERAAVERNRPLSRGKAWTTRADESAGQLATLRTMLWREPDLGVAEATLQDELRQLTGRTGIALRELVVTRVVDRPRSGGDPAAAALDGKSPYRELRARMVFDFRRDRTMALLSELAQSPRIIVVDRFVAHTTALPPTTELEVRVVVDTSRRSGV